MNPPGRDIKLSNNLSSATLGFLYLVQALLSTEECDYSFIDVTRPKPAHTVQRDRPHEELPRTALTRSVSQLVEQSAVEFGASYGNGHLERFTVGISFILEQPFRGLDDFDLSPILAPPRKLESMCPHE